MRSSYKRIGRYVCQVNNRNKDLAVLDLKGINISKQFMPSVANTTGTDLSKYKVVSKYQFAYNPMHVGRDEVLPIGMLEADKPIIVSPAYMVFEVVDPEDLLPEYLMMWCRRSEFDRNAWFTTDSSVRGGFNWDDFCDLTLPVPHPDKQREIVREYNTIVERIKLNEQLNQKLEETAQALYKHWFVAFEFPISKEYAESIGKPELEGKPYKASGGEMVFDDKLCFEIPQCFISSSIGDLITINYGKSLPEQKRIQGNIPVYSSAGITGYHNQSLCNSSSVVIGRKGSIGKVYYVDIPSFCIDTAYYIGEDDTSLPLHFVFILLSNLDLPNLNEDSAVPGLNRNTLYSKKVTKPPKRLLNIYQQHLSRLNQATIAKSLQTNTCKELSEVLLKRISIV